MPESSPTQLIERLAKGKPIPAIVLMGTDPYLRDMCRNGIIQAYVPDAVRDWALARIIVQGGDWGEVFQRAETLPMLAQLQVVIIDGAETIEVKKRDDDESGEADDSDDGDDPRKETLRAFSAYLDSPAPFTILLFEVPKLDKRQRLYKILNDKALIVELTIGDQAAAFVAQMAKELGAEIEPAAATLLAEITNREPALMRMELQKLSLYAQGRGRVTIADVKELVPNARKNTVWELADMIATRRRDHALQFLDNLLREGEEPVALVGVLAWMYRKLIEARDLPAGMRGFQAARPLGMRPDTAEAAIRNAHRMSKENLLAGLVALAETDSQLKSSNPNKRATMEFLIARLTSNVNPASTAAPTR
jgi:DNA polymerase-3 subunit delta